jgi:cell division septal protein FtsQ
MTEKQPEGQDTRRYRYRATASVSRPVVRRSEVIQRGTRGPVRVKEVQRARAEQPVSKRRTVTTPHEAIQPLSWAERQQRFRHPQAEQSGRGKLVSRTFSQTGRSAPVGPVRASRPLPRQHSRAPIPVRSGQSKRSRSFWRRLMAFLTLLAVLAGGISFALLSPTFHVQQVQISGTQNRALIYTIQHMGIQGQNIFLLNQVALVKHLETLPLVASASLSVQLPDSLQVTLQERVPALIWQSGGKTFGVAQDGTILAPLSELSGTDHLATVVDKSTVPVKAGDHLSAANILFVQQALQQLPEVAGIGSFALQYINRIVEVTQTVPANQAGSGSFIVASSLGWLAYLGDAGNSNSLSNRLLELQEILSLARQQHLTLAIIDLRFGLRPTYTLKA